ncbi:hypothetical protein PC9H_001677 [Pleurotus ostreatus]|uniref:Uncharacterized protein n=1 Tax=Pleurotus ostreatus TaxID=5322 RepID=A0A8H7A3J8_PLEOS|nr:uncharacterized protein PC9H_001677 [Pleurotus ostreatus]KAF7441328.1 hypothetical protein PC9H_001677 [Pleurotus ostreatus]KAJ8699130.1 hypothetical protein PTI98_002282 [Pleurotus ostreatus]
MVHIPKFNAVLVVSALASLITVPAVPITQPFEGNGTGRTTHLKALGGNIGAGALPSSGLRGAKAAPSVAGAVATAPSTAINGVAPSSSVGPAASQTSPDASFIPSRPTSVAAVATETVTQTLVVTVSSPPLATVTVTLAQVEPQAAGGVIDGVAGGSAGVAAVGNTPTFTSPAPNLPVATRVAATGPKRDDTPRGGSGPKLI